MQQYNRRPVMFVLSLCIFFSVIISGIVGDFESAGCSDEGCGIPCYLRPAEDNCHYTTHDPCDSGGATELDQQLWLLNNSLVRLQEKLIQKGISKTCFPLQSIDNGGVIYSDLLLSIGVLANYVCNSGYSLHGHGRYECSVDGMWIGNNSEPIKQVPSCEDSLITCDALVPIPYGHISYHVVDTTLVQPGDVASYSCDTLYTLEGTQHRICLRNGTWSGTEPVCLVPSTASADNSTSVNHKGSDSEAVDVTVGVLIPVAAIVSAVAVAVLIYFKCYKKRGLAKGYKSISDEHHEGSVRDKEMLVHTSD